LNTIPKIISPNTAAYCRYGTYRPFF
jgi:hypothetical protein